MDSSTKMMSRASGGEAAGEGVLQGGSMRGCQDKVSGTTMATPGHQKNWIGVSEMVSSHLISHLLSKDKVWR